MDAKSYISLIELMLVRASNYVFLNCRKHVFGDFMENGVFDLEQILTKIEEC
jgi:hypothetical protein